VTQSARAATMLEKSFKRTIPVHRRICIQPPLASLSKMDWGKPRSADGFSLDIDRCRRAHASNNYPYFSFFNNCQMASLTSAFSSVGR
jgi:hypothetical protein